MIETKLKKYKTQSENLNVLNEPQVLEFETRNNWTNNKEKEINDKINVISLFSGSGGLDLGFLETGKFEIVFANDFNYQACQTYTHNIGNHILCDDIANIKNLPQADVIIGGPPCQGFSTANPARSFDDPRNQLFKEYARIIKQVQPKLFLMENVSGMVTMQKGKVFELIRKELTNCGYKLSYKLLNSRDYGVPQSRRRMIIIGVRNDLEFKFEFPKPTHNEENYKTVGDTLLKNTIPKNCPNHTVGKLTELNLKRVMYIPEGGSMKHCPAELQNNSDLNRAMRRLDSKKESYTIVHNNCDHYYHPTENRRITIREMARLQGYPDNYIFLGSKSEQSRQVGNSVPVGLGKAIAKSIFNFLNNL
ncbi:DNA cytosine methyltransferase [Flavobacterium sp. LM4]|uniref:DNA cytosine methyltransferase n=1 Tax=Flavobacterium sp. LM4 TaxID=1938609 RepID=UPI000993BB10|nr:DNA cytosine methyltransferase [Flavobacterium sp. LM4]